MHLAVTDPLVDGKVVGDSLGGFHFHLGRIPGVPEEIVLFVQLYQLQLSQGGRAGHIKV